MRLDYFNTFDTSIDPLSFAYTNVNNGPNNLVYSAANQAIEGSYPNYTVAGLTINPAELGNSFVYEADVELVASADASKCCGLLLYSSLSYSGMSAYALIHFSGAWYAYKLTRYSDHTYTGAGGAVNLNVTPLDSPVLNVGDRKLLRVEWAYRTFRFYVDGVEVLRFADSTFTKLNPGIYWGNGTVRLHSLKFQVSDDPVVTPTAITSNFVWANNESRNQAWPGEIHPDSVALAPKKAFSVHTAKHVYAIPAHADLGYIAGQVTRKSVPAAGQLVYCFDERFNLVAETVSDSSGYYRFDGLLITNKYSLLAQDNFDFKYAPVSADRRTPEAYP